MSVTAGSWALGIRTNTAEAADLIGRSLAAGLQPGAPAYANYSVVIEPDRDRGPRALHRLYRSHSLFVRTRSLERLVDALALALSSHEVEERPDRLCIDAEPVWTASGVVLVPRMATRARASLEGALRRVGARPIDLLFAPLDAETGDLVIDPPAVSPESPASPGVREDAALPAGRYPVVGCLLRSPGESRATAVAEMMRSLRNPAVLDAQQALEAVGALAARVGIRGVGGADAATTAARVVEVSG